MGILRLFSYSILSVSMLAGCTEVLTDEIETTPLLCINSLITAGQPIEVSVTHTWKYSDYEEKDYKEYHEQYIWHDNKVTDAHVDIYVNGTLQDPGYLPKEGDRIEIVATSEKYGMAKSEVTVPLCTPFEAVTWEATPTAIDSTEIAFILKARLTLADNSDIENYYHIAYSIHNSSLPEQDDSISDAPKFTTLEMGELRYQSEPIFGEHVSMLDAMQGSDAYGFTFFTDRRFTGSSYTLNMVLDNMKLLPGESELGEEDFDWKFTFTLYTVTKSLFNFVTYQWIDQYGTISDLAKSGLGNPIWGYSNVSTGAGVIAAQSAATYTIDLKDFLISCMD